MAKLNSTTLSITVSELVKNNDSPQQLITDELISTIEEVIMTVYGHRNNLLVEVDIQDPE